LRAADRSAVLFDLGLGALQIDACVRSADPEVIAALRDSEGRSIFAAGNGATGVILASNPHRVFISRIGRIEVCRYRRPAERVLKGRIPTFCPSS
jgi:hypothetical protein